MKIMSLRDGGDSYIWSMEVDERSDQKSNI